MSDRLDDIKAAWNGHSIYPPDVDWLIGEVERLRGVLAEQESAINFETTCTQCGKYLEVAMEATETLQRVRDVLNSNVPRREYDIAALRRDLYTALGDFA
jgi:hypothetical protein